MKLNFEEKEQSEFPKNWINENNLSVRITNYLLERKFKPNHKGFFYIREAIKKSIEKKDEVLILNKLYMDLANRFLTSPVQVSRDIRYALDKSLDNKFTIKEFISIAVFELSN